MSSIAKRTIVALFTIAPEYASLLLEDDFDGTKFDLFHKEVGESAFSAAVRAITERLLRAPTTGTPPVDLPGDNGHWKRPLGVDGAFGMRSEFKFICKVKDRVAI